METATESTEFKDIEFIAKHGSKQDLIELIESTEEWGSETDHKFYLYEPNDVPKLFHGSEAHLRAIFGGNRSSKTYSHIIDFAAQFTGEAPESLKGIIPEWRLDQNRRLRFCMEDYPNSFSKVVWPYIQQLIPDHTIQSVVKDSGRIRSIVNRKGGFIEFMYYDQEVTKHQGSSRHAIGYDEEPDQSIRDEGLMRLVDTDGEESFSLTPVSGALRYLYDEIYLQRGREVEKNYDLIMSDKGLLMDAIEGNLVDRIVPGGDPDIHVFFACIFDNKVISKSAAIRKLRKFPKNEMIMRAKGKFMFLSGLVYEEYSDAIHLIKKSDAWVKSDDYTLYIAIDPHPRVEHAVLFLVASKDGMLFIVDELFVSMNAEDFVDAIKIKCRGKKPERIIIDPLANAPDMATKVCFTHTLIDAGLNDPMPMSGSKDKKFGIIKSQEILKPKVVVPGEKPIPGIYIMENCTRFRYEIARWSWDDWKKDTQNVKGLKQEPVKKDDHMMENFRRLILLNPRWIRPTEEEEAEIERRNRMNQRGRNRTTGY